DHVLFLNATGAPIQDFATGNAADPMSWSFEIINQKVPVGAAEVVFYGCLVQAEGGHAFEYVAGPQV
ncbi:MAG TPA: hypothetical protein VHI93_06895, partial [Candidatus Thermoplasmatota archaeon]|nr:hypothetical protein [Candidatus Thermoplasmatota archaeon]